MSPRTTWTWRPSMPSRGRSRSTRAVSSSCLTTSVSAVVRSGARRPLTGFARIGLISQVAEELWEVKGRKIKNLTKEDITIVDYKKMLVKNSTCRDLTTRCLDAHDYASRSSGARESQAVQQDGKEEQDVTRQPHSHICTVMLFCTIYAFFAHAHFCLCITDCKLPCSPLSHELLPASSCSCLLT